jgi:membrane fusion protein
MAWAAVALVGLILVFLFLAQYSRKETVSGYLTPATGTARIFAPRQGVVRAVHVQEGQQVEEGQPLLTIDTDQIAATGEDVNATMLGTLRQQRELLNRQVQAEEQRTRAEQQRFAALIRGLEAEITSLKSQVALQSDRIRLSDTLVARRPSSAPRALCLMSSSSVGKRPSLNRSKA